MNYNNAKFETAFGNASQLGESELPEIAFSGRSNVGKSTLINKLLGRKALARVSATPGKTATVNYYRIDDVRFVDLPGYGYAKVSQSERKRWASLMEKYFDGSRDIRLVVQLVDMRHSPTKDDLGMIDFLCTMGIPFVIALTKCDKLNKTERQKRLDSLQQELSMLENYTAIELSAPKNIGIDRLKEIIEQVIED